jgi:hypothetical protein
VICNLSLGGNQELFPGMENIFLLVDGTQPNLLQGISRVPCGWRAEALVRNLV